jgi:hypothetical protein
MAGKIILDQPFIPRILMKQREYLSSRFAVYEETETAVFHAYSFPER